MCKLVARNGHSWNIFQLFRPLHYGSKLNFCRKFRFLIDLKECFSMWKGFLSKIKFSRCCDDNLLCMQIHYVLQEMDTSTSENFTACRILPQFNWPLFQLTFFLSSYVVPLTLICGLYVCMLLRLWRGSRVSAESRRGRKRVTRLVLVVVGVFAFCWCPIQVKKKFIP